MSGAMAASYGWLREEFTDDMGETWLSAGFVRDVSPGEALRRMGVTPCSVAELSVCGVAAYAADGGTFLVESGWMRAIHDQAPLLSAGTAAAAVFMTMKNDGFTYCVDGRSITTFGLYAYSRRRGSDPDRLQADVETLGMDIAGEQPEITDPVSSALALAERATGVHLSPARYAGPALIGSTDHL